jgi:hypothetical protein
VPGSQAHHGVPVDQRHQAGPTGPRQHPLQQHLRSQHARPRRRNDTDCQDHSLAAVLWKHGHACDLEHLSGRSPPALGRSVLHQQPGRNRMLRDTPEQRHARGPARSSRPGGTSGLSVTSGTSQTPFINELSRAASCHHWPRQACGRPGCLCGTGHPAVDGANDGSPGTRTPADLSGLWFKRFADATGTGRNDPPGIQPAKMPRRRTTKCHPERFRKERR